jgi:hypothetical protein
MLDSHFFRHFDRRHLQPFGCILASWLPGTVKAFQSGENACKLKRIEEEPPSISIRPIHSCR